MPADKPTELSRIKLKTWTRQPVPMISKHSAHLTLLPIVHTYIHTYIHTHTYILICWFNFDALAQGNAYKPTKEPINYRGPCGDRTHDLQTEATPPAASCPARTLHATEIASKTQLQGHARGCTGQLTTRLECTGVNFNIHIYIHTCLLLLISMLWHRQAIFESKGDKLSSSAEGRIRTWKSQGTYSPADWMPTHKPTELSRIKLKNLNSTARPYDEWAFSPLDFTAVWLSHLALAIYMFVVVNFDALAQASDIRI